jgi:hypothetical protein
MFKVSDTHYAATWLLHEYAPKVEPPLAVQSRMKDNLHANVPEERKKEGDRS